MRRGSLAPLLVVALVTAACGGAADDADGPDAAAAGETETSTDAPAGDAPSSGTGGDAVPADGGAAPPDEEIQDVIDGLDFGDGRARVELGDQVYEFELGGTTTVGTTTYIGVCQELFGLTQGNGYVTDGRAVTFEFELLPDDWETYTDGRFDDVEPRLEIEDADTDQAWVANASLADLYPEAEGVSQIEDWVTQDSRASGTATFLEVEPWGAPVEGAEPIAGTFELGCE